MTDRVTTPFGKESTASEVLDGVDLHGQRIVVTGGASGIGLETARALVGAGAEVTLAVRNAARGADAARDIATSTGSDAVHVAEVDLLDRDSLRAFGASWVGPLHALVDNAGVMATPETRTPEGWELQFANNHLGHFVLANALHHALAEAGSARLVSLSSSGHHRSPVVFEDVMFERREYDPWSAYGQSKTANVLFAVEAARRFAADGITANAVHPGGIMTNLQRHMPKQELLDRGWVDADGRPNPAFKTTEQGAATSALVAGSPLVAGVTGRYFEDANEAVPADGTPGVGVQPYALDADAARRLWELSESLVG